MHTDQHSVLELQSRRVPLFSFKLLAQTDHIRSIDHFSDLVTAYANCECHAPSIPAAIGDVDIFTTPTSLMQNSWQTGVLR